MSHELIALKMCIDVFRPGTEVPEPNADSVRAAIDIIRPGLFAAALRLAKAEALRDASLAEGGIALDAATAELQAARCAFEALARGA